MLHEVYRVVMLCVNYSIKILLNDCCVCMYISSCLILYRRVPSMTSNFVIISASGSVSDTKPPPPDRIRQSLGFQPLDDDSFKHAFIPVLVDTVPYNHLNLSVAVGDGLDYPNLPSMGPVGPFFSLEQRHLIHSRHSRVGMCMEPGLLSHYMVSI